MCVREGEGDGMWDGELEGKGRSHITNADALNVLCSDCTVF